MMKHTHFPLQNDRENNILVYNCFITNIHFFVIIFANMTDLSLSSASTRK